MSRVDVMQGALSEFSLDNVLRVVSIGRQYVGVELRDESNVMRGTIYVKGSQVVDADAGDTTGVEAFVRLCEGDFESFRVFRLPPPSDLRSSLGPMHELIARVQSRSKSVSMPAARQRSADHESKPHVPTERPGTHTAATVEAAAAVPAPAPAIAASGRRKVVVAIASSKGGVGKTTIALNLALSFAKHGHRTLLIDGDPNGDILSAMDARDRADVGVYDLLTGGGNPADALMRTSLPELSILPASGQELPDPARLTPSLRGSWVELFTKLHKEAEVIVVDSPAGVYGPSMAILASVTHVVGVLQAEAIARRSFSVLTRTIENMVTSQPEILGVVLNQLQSREEHSLDVLRTACTDFPSEWLFDVTIPRHPIFLKASALGVPLGMLDERNPPAAAWLFDGLASELAERLDLALMERQPRKLLL